MKKYKEWLINEIEIMESETSENYPHEQMVEREAVLNLINQLDEPETLSIDKKRLIKRIKNYIPLHDKTIGDVVDGILEIVKELPEMEVLSPEWIKDNTQLDMNPTSRVVPAFLLENLLVPKQELPEQELPVIPEFVADFLEKFNVIYDNCVRYLVEAHNGDLYYLNDMMVEDGDLTLDEAAELCEWAEKQKQSDLLKLINGYTAEEEQRYYVSVRDEEYGGFWFLTKNKKGDISIGVGRDCSEVDWDRAKLTEQEIKNYGERYWAFRKPVEEVEE